MLTDAYAATKDELRAEIAELRAADIKTNALRIRFLLNVLTDLNLPPKRDVTFDETEFPDALRDKPDGLPW